MDCKRLQYMKFRTLLVFKRVILVNAVPTLKQMKILNKITFILFPHKHHDTD